MRSLIWLIAFVVVVHLLSLLVGCKTAEKQGDSCMTIRVVEKE